MEVRDRVAIVTGAGSGIGRATAQVLAAAGARVVVADIGIEEGQASVALIEGAGGTARFCRVDVADEAQVVGMIAFAEATFGGLDILFNNAGVLTPPPRFPDTPSDRWQRALDINLRGVMFGSYYAVPAMKRRGGGVIVQTASSAGLRPYEGDPVYATTKAGIIQLTRSLAFLQKEANIRVNCICPERVRTNLGKFTHAPLTPEEREQIARDRAPREQGPRLTPEQVAEVVMRLITDDSLTGRACHIAITGEYELL
jgi:NAD(P)-dependent dehydrogenase (short-subunit alcohol dehydrogenase family)